MRRILVICIILSAISFLYSSELGIDLKYEKTDSHLLRNDMSGMEANFRLSEIVSFDVNTPEGTFSQLNVPGYTHTGKIGTPKLPAIRKIIAVPFGAEIKITSLNYKSTEYELDNYGINYPVMPAQPPVPKSADPSTIEFKYNPQAYLETSYSDKDIVRVEEIGIMRGMRLFTLIVEPIQYNPVSGTIKVFNNIDVRVDFTGTDLAETNLRRIRTYSPYFESAYQNYVFNYTPISSREDLTRYPIKYVIISDPMFEAQLEPFIEWKIQKGFEVIVGYTDDPAVGSTTTSIKNYIQTLWDAATPEFPAPSFILFVGDVAQIPAWNGSTGGHITDLNYVKIEGGDYLPEIYYGRFSANNETELQPQIDKTLEYERYEMPDPSFLGEVVMIAGMDTYHGSTWGNGQINYGTENYFNVAHGIFSHTYLYPNSGSNSANIIQNVSDGVSYINYTAHGGSTEWCDPEFTIADINGLQNQSKYPLAVGNCCLTNKFEVQTCFGEAWLRAENKGAIGYIGGTNSTYWDEDYWWGVGAGTVTAHPTYAGTGPGAYDGMFHDHSEPFSEWYTTSYAVIMAGNLAVVQGGGSSNYYWEIYSIMGDPSLTTYFGVPSDNIVNYPSTIFLGLSSVQISAEPYSYVSISMNGISHGVGLVDTSGLIDLEIDPFVNPGFAQLVITRQNRVPIIEDIEVIPSGGPYVMFESYIIDDTATGNGNGSLENGEIVDIDMSVENLGSSQATNVIVTITTSDPYITIVDGTENFGNIAAGAIVTVAGAFTIEAAGDIPDSHMVYFELEAVAEDTWISYFSIEAYAPMFPPQNLTGEIQNFNDIVLTWDQPSGADNTRDLTGYKVYKDGLEIAEITDPAILTFTDAVLPAGVYQYYITALFHVGESDPSNIETVTLILPVPQNPEAVTQGLDILVTWDEPATRDFSHYKVYRDMVIIADDIMETSFLDSAVPNGTYCYNIRAVYSGGYQSALSTDAVIEHVQTNANEVIIPVTTELSGNFPNPFNPTTSIKYALHEDAKICIKIFNIKGQKVKTLVDKQQSAGYHTVMWNGKDNSGKAAASGLYFYKMVSEGNSGDYTSIKKMILLK